MSEKDDLQCTMAKAENKTDYLQCTMAKVDGIMRETNLKHSFISKDVMNVFQYVERCVFDHTMGETLKRQAETLKRHAVILKNDTVFYLLKVQE